MKELKLRVWDKTNEKFYHLSWPQVKLFNCNHMLDGKKYGGCEVRFDNLNSSNIPEVSEFPFDQRNYTIQLGSGVVDKFGKEIYDGDAVSYHGRVGFAKFFASMFIVEWPDQTDDTLAHMTILDMEVVGHTNTGEKTK